MNMPDKNGWIDISVTLAPGLVHWPGDPPFELELARSIDQGDACNLTSLSTSAHIGTHMDAPRHFIRDGAGMDELPLNAVLGPCRVIEIHDPEAIRPAELEPHQLQRGERVLFKTRNSQGAWKSAKFVEHFVYVSKEAARLLVDRGVRTVGVDYLSVGGFFKDGEETHQILLGAGIWIIEGLDLERIQPGRYELACLPLKIQGSDGAPARAVLRPLKVGASMSNRGKRLQAIAEEEVRSLIAALPPEIRTRAEPIPLVYDWRGIEELDKEGVGETMGLFVGDNFVEAVQGGGLPPQIILYLENIWWEAEEDEAIYRREVRATLLHELGHYLGLEEIDLEERGL